MADSLGSIWRLWPQPSRYRYGMRWPGRKLCACAVARLGACPRNADFGGRTATLRVARISDSASDADAGFGHLAQSAFSEANLTENHAPDRRANATVAY